MWLWPHNTSVALVCPSRCATVSRLAGTRLAATISSSRYCRSLCGLPWVSCTSPSRSAPGKDASQARCSGEVWSKAYWSDGPPGLL
ncbi:hypothetical protein D3C72_1941830 [compost metagenome]